MYTIGIFGFKIYVCNSRQLMSAIQKNAKTLSFKPFVQMSMKKNSDVSDHTYELGSGSMIDKLDLAQRAALAPGPHLDDQTLRTGEGIVDEMSNLEVDARGGKPVMLLDRVRHVIVQASAYGIYGKHSAGFPFIPPLHIVLEDRGPLAWISRHVGLGSM
jgi:hypothetical protein